MLDRAALRARWRRGLYALDSKSIVDVALEGIVDEANKQELKMALLDLHHVVQSLKTREKLEPSEDAFLQGKLDAAQKHIEAIQ
jgi:hypothetical protein